MQDKIPTAWRNYWLGLAPTDRRLLMITAGVLTLLLLVYGVLIPAHQYADEAAQYHRAQLSLQHWVKENAAKVQSVPQPKNEEGGARPSLLTLASESAKAQAISFKRFEPVGDAELRIWLDDTEFNQLLVWLDRMAQQQGVLVKSASIDPVAVPGKVDARLTLTY